MENLNDYISPEVYEAVRRFGFDKVAARVYGVAEIDEKTAAEIIGKRLLSRTAEMRQIHEGLRALEGLK